MAGHSKWAGIKHKKAIVDSRRGKLFTKLARAITVAAKEGGGDIEGNPRLGLAVQKAKDASMPKDNIERAIAKGTGEGADVDALEDVIYEGYGPGGVALLVEAVTDNRNRTGSEVRHIFQRNGGNLGEPGSVAYLFDKKGLVLVDAERYSEDDLMVAIDAGAEDIAPRRRRLRDHVRARRPDRGPRGARAGRDRDRDGRALPAAQDPRAARRGRRPQAAAARSTRSRIRTTWTPSTPTSTSTRRSSSASRGDGALELVADLAAPDRPDGGGERGHVARRPVGLVYLASRVADSPTPSMGPYLLILIGLPVGMVAVGKVLGALDRYHGRITGLDDGRPQQAAWMKSMRGERERKRRRSVLDTVMMISVGVALLLSAVWFFAFAGSSLPGA